MRKLEFRDYSTEDYNKIIDAVKDFLEIEELNYVVKHKGEKQYIYCFYYNNQILEVSDDEYDQIINKVRITESALIDCSKIKELIMSISPSVVKSMMSISPLHSDNYFHQRHRENIKQINNYELPKHRLMKEDKFGLANIIINVDINLSPEEINNCLVHNQIPFGNYNTLKDNLELYYDTIKDKDSLVHKYVYEDREDACLDVIESMINKYPAPLLLKEGNNHIVYSQISLEHKDMRPDKNIAAFYVLNPEEEQFNHHCFHMFEDKTITKTKLKINEKLRIDIKVNTSYSVDLNLIYEGKTLKLPNFYLPEEDELFLIKAVEKMWSRGLFLTNFGQEYYKNDKKILPETMCVPEWFESTNDEQFRDLLVKISKL
jgi:hypothetical protein